MEALTADDEAPPPDAEAVVRAGGHHFVVDMDLVQFLVSATRCLVVGPLTDEVRSPAGGASLGMIATMLDLGASNPTLVASRPDWTATQDLSLHGSTPIAEGPVVVDSQLIRVGKKVVIVGADVFDGQGEDDPIKLVAAIDRGEGVTLASTGVISFARIPGSAAAGMDEYNPAEWVGHVRHTPLEVPVGGTMYERMQLHVVDAATGCLELERTPYLVNSIGTIMGGAQAVLVEAAAEAMCPGRVATDMQIHYLSQVKAGPARTVSRFLRQGGDHSVVQVTVVDAGFGDQILTIATVTVV